MKIQIKALLVSLLLVVSLHSVAAGKTPIVPQNSCGATITIVSVRYKGKVAGNDHIEVVFDAAHQSPCGRFGDGNLGDNFGGKIITVKVRRQFNHEDTGTDRSIKGSFPPGRHTSTVVVPRGTLETDPVSYEVTVKAIYGGLFSKTVTLSGSGIPAVGPGVQTTTSITSGDIHFRPTECFPEIQVTEMGFISGANHTADTVPVRWVTSNGPGCSCFPPPRIQLAVSLARPNGGSTGSASVENGISQTSINVPVSGAARLGTPTSFQVRVTAEAKLPQILQANKSGNF